MLKPGPVERMYGVAWKNSEVKWAEFDRLTVHEPEQWRKSGPVQERKTPVMAG